MANFLLRATRRSRHGREPCRDRHFMEAPNRCGRWLLGRPTSIGAVSGSLSNRISVRSMLPVGPAAPHVRFWGTADNGRGYEPPRGYLYLHVHLIEVQTNVLAFLEAYK
jgi:hypothetical protein